MLFVHVWHPVLDRGARRTGLDLAPGLPEEGGEAEAIFNHPGRSEIGLEVWRRASEVSYFSGSGGKWRKWVLPRPQYIPMYEKKYS